MAAFALIAAACSSDDSAEGFRIAIVAPSASNDLAFTQSMVDAANTIEGAEVSVTDGTFVVEDAAVAIRDYASDGFDLVLPEPEGAQAASCMRAAIQDAGIEVGAIDYVNTHGTSTIHGDIAEVKAIQSTFGDHVPPFSSTKSMTGHGIGAAGALELIFCIGMMEQGFIAPSINIEILDPAIDGMPVVTETRQQELATVLSNNFGFGGTNASMVIRRFDG